MKKFLWAGMAAMMVLGGASCKKDPSQPGKGKVGVDGVTPLPEAVDIGMVVEREDGTTYKLLWGSFNLGASQEYEFGDYYAWGEIEPHYSSLSPLVWKQDQEKGYDWSNYKHAKGASHRLIKYVGDPDLGWEGKTDDYGELLPEDDPVRQKLGGKWRMPTEKEIDALQMIANKEGYKLEPWTPTVDKSGNIAKDNDGNPIYGLRLTETKTGKSIFIPNAGYFKGTEYYNDRGRYWTSNPIRGNNIYRHDTDASYLSIQNYTSVTSGWYERCYGLSIRPVCEQ